LEIFSLNNSVFCSAIYFSAWFKSSWRVFFFCS